jgi:hypothetical protein
MKFLCTYRFLAFSEKTPSLLFMLRKEELLCFMKNPPIATKNFNASSTIDFFLHIIVLLKNPPDVAKNINSSSTTDFFLLIRADEAVFLQNLFCALAQFHFFRSILRRLTLYPLLVPLMQHDV